MQKKALPLTLTTAVISIFGAFLRWLQTQHIFEESGLAVSGAGISICYVVFSVLAVVAFCIIVKGILRDRKTENDAALALADPIGFAVPIACLLGIVVIGCALVAMFTADVSNFSSSCAVCALMQRIFGAFGIFSGCCLPFVPAKKSGEKSSFSRTAMVVIVLFCCYSLVFAYRMNAEDPVLWAYAPEMLAVVTTTLAFYHIAAYYFNCAKSGASLILVQMAAYFDLSVIFDVRAMCFNGMLAAAALMLLLAEFLLISNMKEGRG